MFGVFDFGSCISYIVMISGCVVCTSCLSSWCLLPMPLMFIGSMHSIFLSDLFGSLLSGDAPVVLRVYVNCLCWCYVAVWYISICTDIASSSCVSHLYLSGNRYW